MRDNISKNNQYGANNKSNYQGSSFQRQQDGKGHLASQGQTQGKKRPDYCWIFNKGSCKDGAKYRFINRCSYCDSAEHGVTCFADEAKLNGIWTDVQIHMLTIK